MSKDPVQLPLSFKFKQQFSDIALKEAVRAVKAITREAIRLKGTDADVSAMLEILSQKNAIVQAAADAIQEVIDRAEEAKERADNR